MGSYPSVAVLLLTMSFDATGVGSLVDLATALPPLDQIPPRALSGLNSLGDSHRNIVDGFLAEQGDGNVNACVLATVTVTVTESEPSNPTPQSSLPARTTTCLTLSSATAQPQRRVAEPPRLTYDPITYYEVAYATFTLIVDSTTLIPLADGSTKTTLAPHRTTITEPYTQTLTKPTGAPAQAASLSGHNEKRQDEAPHDDGPVVVIMEVWVTETITADIPPSPDVVTRLLTATVYPVPESPDPVTQVVTATVYPMPAPLPTEWHPPAPRDEQLRAAVAAAGEANGDAENTKPKATFGVQRHTPRFLPVWTTCTITISSTIATSTVTTSSPVPAYTPDTSSSSTSTISTTPSYVPPASTLTTSASALTSLSTYSSSLTTSTNANASASSSSAATTTPPSTSNAGTAGGGGRGGAALAATMAVLWGLLVTVG